MNTITVVMLLPNLICLSGNFLIISKVLSKALKYTLDDILRWHKIFSQFLFVSSVMLVFGVLSSTFLRISVLDCLPADLAFLFPKQFVMAYSITFTFFLLIFYLPGEFLFRSKLNEWKNGLTGDQEKRIDEVLSRTNVFKIGISLLAPILSSVLLESLKSLG